jgi:hypothetical protein
MQLEYEWERFCLEWLVPWFLIYCYWAIWHSLTLWYITRKEIKIDYILIDLSNDIKEKDTSV